MENILHLKGKQNHILVSKDGRATIKRTSALKWTIQKPIFESEAFKRLDEREVLLGQQLNSPLLVPFEMSPDETCLVSKPFEKKPQWLSQLDDQRAFGGTLGLCLGLAKAVQALHKQGFIHGALHKDAFVVVGTKVLLHEIAFSSPLEEPCFQDPWKQGSLWAKHRPEHLKYLAPEQVNRSGVSLDASTDIYALGIIFFELLTGALPFEAVPQEQESPLTHWGLAHRGAKLHLHDLGRGEFGVLDAILQKMMHASQEDRYHSLAGVIYDLERAKSHPNEPLELGCRDVRSTWTIPETIYGREREREHFLGWLDDIYAGDRGICLIEGPSGSGKTTFVEKFSAQSILAKDAILTSGKFGLSEGDVPFIPLLQAARRLAIALLERLTTHEQAHVATALQAEPTLDETTLGLLSELGLVPELVSLLGESKSSDHRMTDLERTERLRQGLISYFHTLSKLHPILIFIDDVQRADFPTMVLLERLLETPEDAKLAVVFAARSVEFDHNSAFPSSLPRLPSLHTITLERLTKADVLELIQDTLSRDDASRNDMLAEALLLRSSGNAYATRRLLERLYEEGMIRFDRERGTWEANFAAIGDLPIDFELKQAMDSSIRALPSDVRRVLRAAAVRGERFIVKNLAAVVDFSLQEIFDCLRAGQTAGLISLGSQAFDQSLATWRFRHDSVQEALLEDLSEGEALEIMWTWGAVLSEIVGAEIEVARYLLAFGQAPPADMLSTQRVIEACIQSARVAQRSMAHEYAAQTLGTIMELFSSQLKERGDWAEIAVLRSESILLSEHGTREERLELSNSLFRQALDKFGTIERAHLAARHIEVLSHKGLHQHAFDLALDELRRVEPRFPRKLSPLTLAPRLLWAKKGVFDRQPERLREALCEENQDELDLSVLEIIHAATPAAFFVSEPHFAYFAIRGMRSLFRKGSSLRSPFALGVWATLEVVLGNHSNARLYADAATTLMEQRGKRSDEVRVHLLLNSYVRHWYRGVRDQFESYSENASIGLAAGDTLWAGYHCMSYHDHLLWAGDPLPKTLETMESLQAVLERTKSEDARIFCTILQQSVKALLGRTDGATSLGDEIHNELDIRRAALDEDNDVPRFELLRVRAQLHYWHEELMEAHGLLSKNTPWAQGAKGELIECEQAYFQAIVLAELLDRGVLEGREERRAKRDLRRLSKMLKRWWVQCPTNFDARYHHLLAWQKRLDGETKQATQAMRIALTSAKARKCLHLQGTVAMHLAEWLREAGSVEAAALMAQESLGAWRAWGSEGVCERKRSRLRDLLRESKQTLQPVALSDMRQLVRILSEVQHGANEADIADRVRSAIMSELLASEVVIARGRPSDDLSEWRSSQGTLSSLPNFPLALARSCIRSGQNLVEGDVLAKIDTGALVEPAFTQGSVPRALVLLSIELTDEEQLLLYASYDQMTHPIGASQRVLLEGIAMQLGVSIVLMESLDLAQRSLREVEQANQARAVFMTNMSHELRTPLTTITGYVDLLLETLEDDEIEEESMREDLGEIHKSAEEMTELIGNILRVSEHASRTHMPYETNVDDWLRNVWEKYRPGRVGASHDNDARLNIRGLLGEAKIDALSLRQTVEQLLHNGHAFTRQGTVELIAYREGEEIVLEIADDGIGIAPEHHTQIFEPHFQIDSEITREVQGAGIGLALAKQGVDAHGGSIEVISELGKGASFRVRIPTGAPALHIV